MNSRFAVMLGILLLPFTGGGRVASSAELPFGTRFSDGPRDRALIALTFDDGPGEATGKLLDLLQERKVSATFFVLGSAARTRGPLIMRMIAEGHQVACHTDTHPNFVKVPEEKREALLRKEIAACRAAVKAAGGGDVHYMRMPHGYDRPWVHKIAKEEKLVLVNWTYGSDWTNIPESKMEAEYRKRLRPGSILLMHDAGKAGDRAIRLTTAILNSLQDTKLQPTRVDTLLGH